MVITDSAFFHQIHGTEEADNKLRIYYLFPGKQIEGDLIVGYCHLPGKGVQKV